MTPPSSTPPTPRLREPESPLEPPRPNKLLIRTAIIGVLVLVLAVGGWVFIGRGGKNGQSRESSAAQAGSGAGADRAVPVLSARVAARDVPIFLEGIGSVVALKTVMVKPQVDGRLDRTTFDEGQAVHKGDLLAQIDPRPYAIMRAQAQAALARDTAQARSNRLTLERFETVRKENLISQQQLDDQRALVEQMEATIQADKAQVQQANLQLDYARIRSPIDGVTGVRLVDPGNIIRASDPTGIVMVTQLDPIAVMFSLPQDDLPRVSAQMAKGALRVDISSRDGGSPLATGKLTLIDNQINQATATMRLKAVLSNPQRLLWPNQFVKARLLLSIRNQALVVPAAAVQRGPQGTFVYVVAADQKVSARTVKLDIIEGETAVLSDGLRAGEEVVTEGQAQLRPGTRVTTTRVTTTPPGPRQSAGVGGRWAGGAADASGGTAGSNGSGRAKAPP
jgi:multidrug efflux system membrane fusion protein